jgi:hypothetical protein
MQLCFEEALVYVAVVRNSFILRAMLKQKLILEAKAEFLKFRSRTAKTYILLSFAGLEN